MKNIDRTLAPVLAAALHARPLRQYRVRRDVECGSVCQALAIANGMNAAA
jgi:hypothetical protein